MRFKVYSTDKYADYGLGMDKLYADEIKEVLEEHNFDFEIVEDSKESYFTINIDSIENIVLLSNRLPKQQGLIVNGDEIEIYNGYREL